MHKNRIFLHLIFWFFLIVNIINSLHTDYDGWEMLGFISIFVPINALLIYFNNYILVPRFLFPRKYWTYIPIISALILFFSYLEFNLLPIKDLPGTDSFWFIVPNLIIFVMIATALKYVRWSIQQDKEIKELERKQQLAELARLKAQVNPHFLFNTLNHTYALSLKEDARETGESILSLSSLMKYMLLASKQQLVSLESELNYIVQYIQLEKGRFGDRLNIQMEMEDDFSDVFLPPFLLIPFVENIFKHGYFPSQRAQEVSIVIKRSKQGIEFYASNPRKQEAYPSSTHIGIKNIRERLQIYFPDQHELHIQDSEDCYIVNLKIADCNVLQ